MLPAAIFRISIRHLKIVITGFNTDVEHTGKTYHVQTEDKGLETPFILTLVYDGGTILASRRQPYDDLFTGGFREKDLAARLQRQHSLICAAIGAGRIAELIDSTIAASANGRKRSKSGARRSGRNDKGGTPIAKPGIEVVPQSEEIPKSKDPIIKEEAVQRSLAESEEPIIEDVRVLDDSFELPGEAVAIVSDMAGQERPVHNKLCLEFVNETAFHGGERKNVTFMLSRGNERKVVGNAKIVVKVLGANIRPQIFHSITDQNGLARLEIEVPEFSGGRAAFLVRAINGSEEVELRRAILQP